MEKWGFLNFITFFNIGASVIQMKGRQCGSWHVILSHVLENKYIFLFSSMCSDCSAVFNNWKLLIIPVWHFYCVQTRVLVCIAVIRNIFFIYEIQFLYHCTTFWWEIENRFRILALCLYNKFRFYKILVVCVIIQESTLTYKAFMSGARITFCI